MNTNVGKGREVLTRPATFVINSVGVWGVGPAGLLSGGLTWMRAGA